MLLRQKETYIPVGDDGMHTEIGQEQPSAKTTLPLFCQWKLFSCEFYILRILVWLVGLVLLWTRPCLRYIIKKLTNVWAEIFQVKDLNQKSTIFCKYYQNVAAAEYAEGISSAANGADLGACRWSKSLSKLVADTKSTNFRFKLRFTCCV